MEKEIKNIKFFELPQSFEDDVLEKIRKIKKRRRIIKAVILPLILLGILSLVIGIFRGYLYQKGKMEGESLTMIGSSEQKTQNDLFLEIIPVKNLEKENIYLIEYVGEKKEKIYTF